MTVVVWKGNKLAADRQMTSGDSKQEGCKLFKVQNSAGNECLVSTTNNYSSGIALIEWFTLGEKVSEWPVFQSTDDWARLIVLGQQGIYFYENSPHRLVPRGDYAAWGSGRSPALGALFVGATVQQAVEASIYHDTGCGFGVDCAEIPQL